MDYLIFCPDQRLSPISARSRRWMRPARRPTTSSPDWSKLPADLDRQMHVATHVSVTGLEWAMLALYREDGAPNATWTSASEQRALPEWNLGIVIGRRDLIEGHVYAYVSRCVAQLELYRLATRAAAVYLQSRRVIRFLTADDGMAVTGAVGQWEIWTADQDVRRGAGRNVRHGLPSASLRQPPAAARQPGLRRPDGANHLQGRSSPPSRPTAGRFATSRPWRVIAPIIPATPIVPVQLSPHRGRTADHGILPFELRPGGQSLYAVGSDHGLGSDLSLQVRQETEYPNSGRVVLHLDPSKPATFPLQLRIPHWCTKAVAAVNGRPLQQSIAPGTFLVIERQWRAGDQVSLDMPMAWRLVLGRNRQSGRVAVMRGPLVFCLDPSQNAAIKAWDAADLTSIILDPASLKESRRQRCDPAAWPARCVPGPPGSGWGALETCP